ncbi:MAG: N-acetylmuramoyl-L-alanine amidase [Selenomonadaceae bacterium]|nr:N-acetylmuramoyl-L-alanine amidase [Selenomonadaceae bacterium]
MHIALNAGHMSGMDPGACGSCSTEADICRQVMESCAALLRDSGYEVLTFQSDELESIVGASDGFGADIFVSIHCNGAVTQAAKGTEVYAMSEAGYELGLCIDRAIVVYLGTADRGVKDGSRLYVVNQTEATAVLVELAFITNQDDEWLLNQRTDDFASALAAGIIEYCR